MNVWFRSYCDSQDKNDNEDVIVPILKDDLDKNENKDTDTASFVYF